MAYHPARSVLTLTRGKQSTAYFVTEAYTGPGWEAGRAFKLVKEDGSGSYDLFLAVDRRRSTCDCPGCTYEAAGRANERAAAAGKDTTDTLGCIHLDGVAHAVDAGWLTDPRANPDRDTGPTEHDDREMPACFTGVSGTGNDVPF